MKAYIENMFKTGTSCSRMIQPENCERLPRREQPADIIRSRLQAFESCSYFFRATCRVYNFTNFAAAACQEKSCLMTAFISLVQRLVS